MQLYLTTHNNGYGDLAGGGLESTVSTAKEVADLIADWDGALGNEAINELEVSITRRTKRYGKRLAEPFVGDSDGSKHLARINQEKGWLENLKTKKAEVAAAAKLARENEAAAAAADEGCTGVRVSLEKRLIAEGGPWTPRRPESLAEVRGGEFVTAMTDLTGVVLSASSSSSDTHFSLDFTVDELATNGAAAYRCARGPLVQSAVYANLG
jgi:hypothetical protein